MRMKGTTSGNSGESMGNNNSLPGVTICCRIFQSDRAQDSMRLSAGCGNGPLFTDAIAASG
jgi:hypothetical protein